MTTETGVLIAELREMYDKTGAMRLTIHVDDVQRLAQRAADWLELLEAIVVDLAKQDDPSYDAKLGDIKCRYCHEWGRHNAECAWRRALDAAGAGAAHDPWPKFCPICMSVFHKDGTVTPSEIAEAKLMVAPDAAGAGAAQGDDHAD